MQKACDDVMFIVTADWRRIVTVIDIRHMGHTYRSRASQNLIHRTYNKSRDRRIIDDQQKHGIVLTVESKLK